MREGRGHLERLLWQGGRRGGGPQGKERAGGGEWGTTGGGGGVGQVRVGRQLGGGERGESRLRGQYRAEESSRC